ncbi:MAG: serine O-acetyltransferase [Telmatospirillum sp.]|nr:serine O-acetyltransferase [Telmatospirillum sp.]
MVFKRLREEIESIRVRDPAARSRLEILLCYPGLHALFFYRIARWAWIHGFTLAGRFLSHVGKMVSGIEIHPGATIGQRLFIDHGTGVVIGETAVVGDDVTLYQGVTLGGTSLHKGKRHPTLGDRVIVGSGAQILGPITVADDARIGANAVVLSDVPAGVTMVGIPARAVGPGRHTKEFLAYACDAELPDPLLRLIEGLHQEIEDLRDQVAHMQNPTVDVDGTDIETRRPNVDVRAATRSTRKGVSNLT